jgi:hypothetical protein
VAQVLGTGDRPALSETAVSVKRIGSAERLLDMVNPSRSRRTQPATISADQLRAQLEKYGYRVEHYLAAVAAGRRDRLHHVQMYATLNELLNKIKRLQASEDRDRLEVEARRILERLASAKSPAAHRGPRKSASKSKSAGKSRKRRGKAGQPSTDRVDREGWPTKSVRTVSGGLPTLGMRR